MSASEHLFGDALAVTAFPPFGKHSPHIWTETFQWRTQPINFYVPVLSISICTIWRMCSRHYGNMTICMFIRWCGLDIDSSLTINIVPLPPLLSCSLTFFAFLLVRIQTINFIYLCATSIGVRDLFGSLLSPWKNGATKWHPDFFRLCSPTTLLLIFGPSFYWMRNARSIFERLPILFRGFFASLMDAALRWLVYLCCGRAWMTLSQIHP